MLTRRIGPTVVAITAFVLVFVAAGVAIAFPAQEIQVAVVLVMVIGVAGLLLIPGVVRRDPSLRPSLLTAALVVAVLGILARYLVFVVYYGGSGDVVGYHNRGIEFHTMVRSLDFSFLSLETLGTPIIGFFNGFVYAITGPSMVGAFLVFGMLAFLGRWFFYRAHRIAFPEGEHGLYFAGMFFLPSLVYWPASLGKDAIMIFALGLGTLGLARLFRGFSLRGAAALVAALLICFLVREAVALLLLLGAAGGLIARPGRITSPLARPVRAAVLIPILLVGVVFAVQFTAERLHIDESVEGVIAEHQETSEGLFQGGSAFDPLPITSPLGLVLAPVTVLFRPFVWELRDALGLVAGLEGLIILGLVVFRGRQMVQSLKRWRSGMVVTALLMTLTLIFTLSSFTNFGLLARQRTQLLPFLLMLFTAVVYRRVKARRVFGPPQEVASARRARMEAEPAGTSRMRAMTAPTDRG